MAFNKIFIFLMLIFTNLFGKVIEIKNIKEVKKEIKKYSLVIFDLDNTIMEPVQHLGSDQWFFHRIKHHEKNGLDFKESLERTLHEWYEIQAITKVKLVEKDIKNLIENLQKDNIAIMGLTTRDVDFSLAALKQLKSLDISLDKSSLHKQNIFFENGILYKNGILFANGMNKGHVLDQFFKKIDFLPKSVVFIDDKLKHLTEVENFCKKVDVKFLGFRYGYLDEKVKNFDKNIADIQHKKLKILSNKEAKRKLK